MLNINATGFWIICFKIKNREQLQIHAPLSSTSSSTVIILKI